MYDALLSPGTIGPLELRNRIVMAPMGSNLCEPDGSVGDRLLDYYEARARGGVGLVIVGVAAILHPIAACNPNQVSVARDEDIPGLAKLAERVHAHGAKIALQVQHAGKVAVRDMVAGRPMWVPSPVAMKAGDLTHELTPEELDRFTRDLRNPEAKVAYHEMDVADIVTIEDAFADAAARAEAAGFDAVELHAGHGYLVSSFLSPATNRRTDAYGGGIEGRARLLVETLRKMRARLGARVPVWCRLDAREFRTPDGITEADGRRAAGLAARAGAAAIHVSAYADSSSGRAFTEAPLVHAEAGYAELAAAIKAEVDVPVIAVGRIEPELGDRMIREGRADFIAMARKLLADPELPAKLGRGEPANVRPCVYCYTCVGRIFLNQGSRCAVNPASGREGEPEVRLEATAHPRRVVVLGGGPAGLETARRLALRGHRVTVLEAGSRLGGALRGSAFVNAPNGRLVEWLERAIGDLKIETRLGEAVAPEALAGRLQALDADAVVIAIGAARPRPAVPGAESPRVVGLGELVPWLIEGDVLDRLGPRVAVLGATMAGVQLAERLARAGRRVDVIEAGDRIAPEMAPPRRWRTVAELGDLGVTIRRGTRLVRIDTLDAGDLRLGLAGGDAESLDCDHLIVTTGAEPRAHAWQEAARLAGIEAHVVGDAGGPGYIEGAMRDAARVAASI